MSLPRTLPASVAWLALACTPAHGTGTSGAARVEKRPTSVVVSPSPASTASAPAPPAPSIEQTAPTGPAACVLRGEPWLPENESGVLKVRPDGPGFVHVAVSVAEVEIPVGKASHVFVRMHGTGWHVAGHLAAASFSVQPMKQVVHDGFLVTSDLSILDLVEADGAGLRLAVRAPPVVRRAHPPAPELYACDAVNLGPLALRDAEAALPGDPRARRPVALRVGQIPLSLEPGAAPVAWLLVGESPRDVVELGRSGAHRRIGLTDSTALAFGWVPQEWVRARAREERGAMGFGGLGLSGLGESDGAREEAPKPSPRRCSTELPLLARVGGELMQVGTIDAGTPITISQGEGAVQIDAPGWLKLAEGATLETERDALARCSP